MDTKSGRLCKGHIRNKTPVNPGRFKEKDKIIIVASKGKLQYALKENKPEIRIEGPYADEVINCYAKELVRELAKIAALEACQKAVRVGNSINFTLAAPVFGAKLVKDAQMKNRLMDYKVKSYQDKLLVIERRAQREE